MSDETQNRAKRIRRERIFDDGVLLELTEEAAAALRGILYRIGGQPKGPRGDLLKLAEVLDLAYPELSAEHNAETFNMEGVITIQEKGYVRAHDKGGLTK